MGEVKWTQTAFASFLYVENLISPSQPLSTMKAMENHLDEYQI